MRIADGGERNTQTELMIGAMRRMLSAVGANEGIEILLNRLAKTQSNAEFLSSLTKSLEA